MLRASHSLATLFLVLLGVTSSAAAQTVLVAEGDALRYFKGTEQPEATWTQAAFDDSSWEQGTSPIGYSDAAIITFGTRLTDMQNGYLTLYTRQKFNVPDKNAVKALVLKAKHDDGFVAYLNGQQVHCQNMSVCENVTKDTVATDHEEVNTFTTVFLKCEALDALVSGDNVLAAEGHNVAITSSDFVISLQLETIADLCPYEPKATYNATTNQVTVTWRKPNSAFVYDSLELFRDGVKIEGATAPKPNATSYRDRDVPAGQHEYRLETTACGVACTPISVQVTAGGGNEPTFRRGDANDDGVFNITDAVFLLDHLFRGGTAPDCPDAADVDDDGGLQITDAVYSLNHLFRGGVAPPAPGATTCGSDPAASADALAACTYKAACQ